MKPSHPLVLPSEITFQNQAILSTEKFPTLDDPKWEKWAEPLLSFLAHPRDWAALHSWAKSKRISGDKLKNLLAWLSIRELADVRYQEVEPGKVVVNAEGEPEDSDLEIVWFRTSGSSR